MIRHKIYFGAVLLLVTGLSFSRAFVSISYVILIVTWFSEGNITEKLSAFFRNKPAFILSSVYLMHLAGLLYTTDFDYAWLEVRTKVPLLFFPLIFSTIKPFSKKEFVSVLLLFGISVTASFGTSLYFLFTDSPVDFRETFHFVSHIRLSLMAVIAVSVFMWLSFSKKFYLPLWTKVLMVFMSVFLLWSIVILEVMSGMLLFMITFVLLGIVFLFSKTSMSKRIAGAAAIAVILALVFSYVFMVVSSYNKVIPLKYYPKATELGNNYQNFENDFPVENGSPIGRLVCWKEIKKAWNERSQLPFDGYDMQGNALKYTILRYLNSKHLSKDYKGVYRLSGQDIKYIEEGFANVEYTRKFSIKKRIYKVLWEYNLYKKEGKIESSSGVKRLFLWETGLKLIKKHPWFGVGTGDVKRSFNEQLVADNSPLAGLGLRSHNQLITIAVAFGITGFLWFIFSIFYPFVSMRRFDFLFLAFFITYFVSMLWEDSLETLIGVTIFAFFYPFYLFQNPFLSSEKSF